MGDRSVWDSPPAPVWDIQMCGPLRTGLVDGCLLGRNRDRELRMRSSPGQGRGSPQSLRLRGRTGAGLGWGGMGAGCTGPALW